MAEDVSTYHKYVWKVRIVRTFNAVYDHTRDVLNAMFIAGNGKNEIERKMEGNEVVVRFCSKVITICVTNIG